jgi:hypothetical protein
MTSNLETTPLNSPNLDGHSTRGNPHFQAITMDDEHRDDNQEMLEDREYVCISHACNTGGGSTKHKMDLL